MTTSLGYTPLFEIRERARNVERMNSRGPTPGL
jgi:hypothetical protein